METTHEPDVDLDEVGAFISTLVEMEPDRLTACSRWTVHDLVAHLTAGSAEMADLVEEAMAGRPARPTRGFDEREAPYRLLDHAELMDRLFAEGLRLATAGSQLAERGPATVAFTGRPMRADELVTHARSERALHRWDLVGRDDVGWAMLSPAVLTAHAVTVLNEMPSLAETPANRLGPTDDGWEVVLRSDGRDDVIVRAERGGVHLSLVPPADRRVTARLEPAARLLVLWGRREPSAPIVVDPGADRELLGRLFGW